MQFTHDDVITILGRRGCGKSFLGKQIQKIYPRKFIFDMLHEYKVGKNDFEINNFSQFCKLISEIEQKGLEKFTAIIRFGIDDESRFIVFDEMIKVIYHLGNCTIVVEEVHNFIDSYNIGNYFSHAFTTGRHKNLSIILTTQRPSKMHKDALSQSSHIFAGNLTSKADISHVSDALNIKGEEIAQLDNCEFWYFCPFGNPKVRKINTKELFSKH